MPQIGVIGAGSCSPETAALAEEVGAEIALREGVLVCGGLGGVMEAAARGAKQAGGITVGILPGNRFSDANPFIDIPIVTDLGHARNALVVHSSQALIAITGGYGTLSEIALALKLGKPVIGIKTWNVDPKVISTIHPAEAVAWAYEMIAHNQP